MMFYHVLQMFHHVGLWCLYNYVYCILFMICHGWIESQETELQL